MFAPIRSVVLRTKSLTGPVSPPGPSLRFSHILLIEEPGHQGTPLSAPVLVPGILHGHSFRCYVAIEAKSDVDEYFAHDSPVACSDVGLTACGSAASAAERSESAAAAG